METSVRVEHRILYYSRAPLITHRAASDEKIFRQSKQKTARIVDPIRRFFVTNDGKDSVDSLCEGFLEVASTYYSIAERVLQGLFATRTKKILLLRHILCPLHLDRTACCVYNRGIIYRRVKARASSADGTGSCPTDERILSGRHSKAACGSRFASRFVWPQRSLFSRFRGIRLLSRPMSSGKEVFLCPFPRSLHPKPAAPPPSPL